MYSIYHIPTFVHKDGSIGKIGCTKNIKRRLQQQGYQSFEILETHDCIDSASVREQELQKEYGYKVDTSTYKESIKNIPIGKQHIGGSASLKSQWKNDYDRMVNNSRRAGKSCYELRKGCHSLSYEEHSKNGSKGYAKGLGSLSKETRKEFLRRANLTRMKNRKFTKEQVQWIRKVFTPRHSEYGCVALSKQFNVTSCCIRNLIKKRTYKDY